MRFIHCADLHLDSKIDSLPKEHAKVRRQEIIASFERLCTFAKDNSVTAVIIAGDAFDTRKVSTKTLSRFFHAISKTPCDFLYLAGNHDEATIKFAQDIPNNLYFFQDDWTQFRYGNVNIVGANSVSYGILSETLSLNEQDKNIVVMHGQIAGYKSDIDAELISLPRLKNKHIDYLALGHIHSYSLEKLDNRGVFAYSGCLDGRGFDETGEKGFILLEETEKGFDSQFIPFSSRQFIEEEYVLNSEFDWWKQVDAIISTLLIKYNESSLIKLVLKGKHKADYFKDLASLTEKLNQKFFYAKVYDKTTLQIDVKDYEYDKSVKGEFVRLVFSSDLNEEQKNSIILCGLNAFKGEE